MAKQDTLTTLENMGEFGLIDHLAKMLEFKKESTIMAIGDDAAVIRNEKPISLLSTDMYLEGVHFDLVYTPLIHLGYKVISATISDIYAMNGMPTQVVVGIALSSKYTLEAIEEIYKGMKIACDHFKVDLVGGDTSSSRIGLCISVTALGFAEEKEIVYRNGAGVNDLICVSGDLGGAYIGLQVLEREKRVFMEQPEMQPELSGFDYVLKRQLRPEARKDVYETFKTLNLVPTAMIDVSDGLASEIMHICKNSDKGCIIYEDKIPFDENTRDTALKFNLDPTLCALSGGEDYELLFTVAQEDVDKIKNDPDFSIIGYITEKEEGCKLMGRSGNLHPLQAQGWKHFES